ncbi:isoprenylcysteine carboxyl methyltransferase family protein [Desulfuribacillus alkaliarsenatis]|uniref:Isoprenylcysteine carboxyl methyltransferase n=1 Tax=Desulfuribacillus alkaliarsenatis TaxID=766136 RepID=A0A1E5G190_9FIRM|nr:isoprenylcysteine carboxylmethyltransferase family protein [Desulfuribacillus alkaliarsenatis]OEF96680.1 hypothetical protein BHF68_06275 [Desulfuribacillus alkaliarsenatis]
MLFLIGLLIVVILQRIGELQIAARNEQWMREQGAVEHGKEHYKYIVMMHVLFFVSLLTEVIASGAELATWWWIPFVLFMLAQALRFWTIRSLGQYWNTKILVIPNAERVNRGPYRFIRHPNYLIVALEIIAIPLIFQAFITAAVFTVLNAWILLYVRIPAEEKALRLLAGEKLS